MTQLPTLFLPVSAGAAIAIEHAQVYNTLGAGDAFAGGLIYGYVQGWNWHDAARFGNAVGAIVVTRHACANDMPSLDEVTTFIRERAVRRHRR